MNTSHLHAVKVPTKDFADCAIGMGLKAISRIVMMHLRWISLSLLVVMASSQAFSGEFRIMPMSLELGKGVQSGTFSVINDGKEKLNCQISVKEWTQDATGKDMYAPTSDIVFFPKIMTVEPNDQHVIRVGVKGPPPPRERTYRLFIEEIPEPKKKADKGGQGTLGAAVTIAFRFTTPIFFKPAQEQRNGAIEKLELSKGILKTVVRNTGNVHIKIPSLIVLGKAVDGRVLFSQEIAGWYILQGLSRSYEAQIVQDVCNKLSLIEVKADTESLNLHGTLNVNKEMCIQ